ncbi:hypothetical protein Kpol_1023p91 [Vanderwaltozyma polyspora DSM 70294]|uniref:GOLD domain-containing protein n=1 Tax=Vanderwaltozyma polyspora (strain ATCC 22028 / DSM 70294 / BCRC 21397 / CBS 2163 / NBRC 10782 / NRRL Y-8283 / UCD 57-17) TaxID=436907 RepID=A7TFW2_VANPO|nr:uncharacterized protein Kpol_1023p91 [Vanderwaltozyma polyspora DSM 70294]EDO18920.1 hypothetical protein Kpol_1023p91 [Vanderwaltozyma polyspora DSM 70294]
MKSILQLLILSIVCLSNVECLNFDIQAYKEPEPFCVRDFAREGQLVNIEIDSNGKIGDGQELSVYVRDSIGNEYRRKKNFDGSIRVAFNSPHDVHFDVCFENIFTDPTNSKPNSLRRTIDLDIESGSEARDWNKISALEKLKPIDLELRKIEELADELVEELSYMKIREAKLRDTNESTNTRVKNFSFLIIIVLITLGSWQLSYLKSYFKAKNIL